MASNELKTDQRGHLALIAATFAFAAFVFLLQQAGFWATSDARLRDKLLEPREASREIIIVAIDDRSIQEFGVWPWPRSLHADMIDLLSDAGAKSIGYDVTFSEASTLTEDAALAKAIADSGRTVLASEAILRRSNGDIPTASERLLPIESLRTHVAGFGVTTLVPDRDGVIRHVPVTIRQDGIEEKTFALHLFERFGASRPEIVLEDGLYRVPFVGPPGSFRTVSFIDVIHGTVSAETFRDKIVLVGATAADLHDEYLTPLSYGRFTPGVEIQANVLQGLIEERSLRTFSRAWTVGLYAILCALATLLLMCLRLRWAIPSTFVLALGYLIVALVLSSNGFLAPVLYPYVILIGVTLIDVTHRYLHESKRRRWIHAAFGHYLAPQVVEKIVRGETPLSLGGVRTELTILFSDIRGFTSLSEKLRPEDLVALLNEYLTAMTDIVLGTEGVVDKYIGDAIMAFWGAPMPAADHAVRAASTAVRMKVELARLQAKWKTEGKPEINIGIGLNTGTVVVGNMGSKTRFDYTAMGDDVNLASRLESLTKQYGVTILISEATRDQLGNQFLTRPIDIVAVKGKTKPVKIYELLSLILPANPPPARGGVGGGGRGVVEDRARVDSFVHALTLYQSRRWDDARAAFQNLVDQFADAPSKMYVDRCEYMKTHDPGEGWDGVFVAMEK